MWETLEPTFLDLSGPFISTQLRGFVENMGPGPGNTSRLFGFCLDDDPTICFPDDFVTVEDSQRTVTGANNQTPPQPLVTHVVDLLPDTFYRVRFSLNESGLLFGFKPTGSAGVLTFTTPSVLPAEPLIIESHPLELELAALGVDLNISLFFIGLLLMGLGLGIVSLVGEGEDKDLMVMAVVMSSANVFLRFWPAILLIFLALFVGWVLVSKLTGAGGGEPDGS